MKVNVWDTETNIEVKFRREEVLNLLQAIWYNESWRPEVIELFTKLREATGIEITEIEEKWLTTIKD